MFQPAIFRIEDIETMHQLMLDHPFATLISSQNGHINADHLPLVLHPELSEKGVIRAHIAKGNSLWLERDNSMEALAIFHGLKLISLLIGTLLKSNMQGCSHLELCCCSCPWHAYF